MLDKEAALKKMNSKLDDEVAKYWQTPPPEILDVEEPPPQATSGKKRRYVADERKSRYYPALLILFDLYHPYHRHGERFQGSSEAGT